jgi:hypothetical protein
MKSGFLLPTKRFIRRLAPAIPMIVSEKRNNHRDMSNHPLRFQKILPQSLPGWGFNGKRLIG